MPTKRQLAQHASTCASSSPELAQLWPRYQVVLMPLESTLQSTFYSLVITQVIPSMPAECNATVKQKMSTLQKQNVLNAAPTLIAYV